MSFIILGASALIGFKAYGDFKASNAPVKIEKSNNNTVRQVVETPDKTNPTKPVNSKVPSDSLKINPTPKPIAKLKPAIDKQVRIDQQRLYMVIAGGFQEETNAQSHQLQLKQLGYDAEVVRFKNSRLHVVCAGKFQESKQANSLVNTLLQSHRIEAYVQMPI
ncbi:MAG: SPOR domain-containing protein [Chitinophagales bacterium]